MHRRLVAGVEKQDRGRDDIVLAEPALLGLRGDEAGEKVFPRTAASLGDEAPHKGGEVLCRGDGAALHVLIAAELVHGHHSVRPVEQHGGHVLRYAEEVGDDGDGDGSCEARQQVRLAVGDE